MDRYPHPPCAPDWQYSPVQPRARHAAVTRAAAAMIEPPVRTRLRVLEEIVPALAKSARIPL